MKTLKSILPVLFVLACSSQIRQDSLPPLQVYRINTGISNVYLLNGERLIMIDCSVPEKRDFLLEKIRLLGFRPEEIALLVITHGHGDHAGNGRFFQETYKIPVAAGASDLDKFANGRTDLGKAVSIGVLARLIRGMSDQPYPAFTPDILVKEEMKLDSYGIPGKILPLPGHTPGSLVVTAGDAAFVGDLIRGGVVFEGSATEHFFHEDRALAREQLRRLGKVRIFYPGHFGPLSDQTIREYLN